MTKAHLGKARSVFHGDSCNCRDGRGWIVALTLLAAVLWPGAGDLAAAELLIRQVRVEGNTQVNTTDILAQVRSRSGTAFKEELISEDARRIIIMPEILDVQWRVTPVAGEVDIVFAVVEAPRITALEIVGNKHIETDELLKKLLFEEDDWLDRHLIRIGSEAIEQEYRDQGYYFAEVRVNTVLLEKDRHVVYVVVEGPRVRVSKVRFEGNEAFGKRKLKSKVASKAYFPIFVKGRLDDEKIERDLMMLPSFYRDEGYLDARVFLRKDFNEDKSRVELVYVIDEGPLYKVADISFVGNTIAVEELTEKLKLKRGDVLTEERRIFARRAINRAYGQRGHIYARVSLEPRYREEPGEVDVFFRIDEGRTYKLGKLIVRGNHQTQDKVIRRAFDHFKFLPGGVYDTQAMGRGRRRLRDTGYFEGVSVLPIGDSRGERDALVEVIEGPTGLILFGVGVDTNSGVMGQFSIEQRNFDISKPPKSLADLFGGDAFVGGGQRLRLNAAPGTERSSGSIKFHEPYLFDQENYLDVSLFITRWGRESYLEERAGGVVTLGRRFENDWSADIGVRAETIDVSELDKIDGVVLAPADVQKVEGGNFLTSVKVGVGVDTTDSFFRASEGYKLSASWEQTGVFGGEFTYASIMASGTFYRTVYMDITERKTVWSSRVRVGRIIGDAPVFERFYVGGLGSLRGFNYRGVSPRQGPDRDPIGSEWLFLAATEVTHPLHEELLFGKIFCDSGVVEEGRYRVTVGFGFELLIPQMFQMVPMNFDFAFPLQSDDEDEERLFSFSLGMSF